MSRITRFTSLACVALAFGLATAGLGGQTETRKSEPATLTVLLPADALLKVDGVATNMKGDTRTFESPPLTPGKKYSYVLKASWTEKGKLVEREEKVRVAAGIVSVVNFNLPAAAQDDKKDKKDLDKKDQDKKDKEPDVIYVPTPNAVVEKMLELAEVKKGDVVYDLGCGDGRIVVTAAKKYGVKGFGYDIDPERVKDSLKNVEKNKVGDLVTIKKQDIFELDLKDASVVTLYLLPELNVKLMPQLAKLKPGSRIVSHDFDMKGAKPKKVVTFEAKGDEGDGGREHTIYLWVVPWEKEEEK
jgi:uncharacterized protein (TIGR03000 family)